MKATTLVVMLAGTLAITAGVLQAERDDLPARAAAARAPEPTKDMQAKAAAGVVALRNAMKDPEAFVLRSLIVKDNGTGCVEYRAKNSFGAMFPGSAVVMKGGSVVTQEQHGNRFVSEWNRECTRDGGRDLTEFVQTRLL